MGPPSIPYPGFSQALAQSAAAFQRPNNQNLLYVYLDRRDRANQYFDVTHNRHEATPLLELFGLAAGYCRSLPRLTRGPETTKTATIVIRWLNSDIHMLSDYCCSVDLKKRNALEETKKKIEDWLSKQETAVTPPNSRSTSPSISTSPQENHSHEFGNALKDIASAIRNNSPIIPLLMRAYTTNSDSASTPNAKPISVYYSSSQRPVFKTWEQFQHEVVDPQTIFTILQQLEPNLEQKERV
ncbi:hypothetical protein JYU14_05195, partial [Simkania negevensis]|nr:hypothetical protein [Simkania negevensis]